MTDFTKITDAFRVFNNVIKVQKETLDTANERLGKMRAALDNHYYGSYQYGTVIKVGSIGRQTDIHASDIDIIYKVPQELYARYNAYSVNGQSAMLYAFRDVIRGVYSTTNIKADGLVAAVKFADRIDFELMPGIRKDDGSFTYPISNGGGSWGRTVPMPEIEAMDALHGATNRNARKLARMVRAWKDYSGATMGGLLIDTYVHRFLKDYGHKTGGYVYYDWMTRDFFKFLSEQNDQVSYIYALGSNQLIYLKGGFTYKAKVAYQQALDAIEAYDKDFLWTSKNHWQSIYGTKFPDFS